MNRVLFRFRSMLAWSVILWAELFVYTILTIENKPMFHRAMSVAFLFVTVCLFLVFISCGDRLTGKLETESQRVRKYQQLKSWILFAGWAALITAVLFLRTIEWVQSSLFVLIYIATTAILTSIVWCVVSRAKNISDASWHWYVWSIITFVAVGSLYGYSFLKGPSSNGTSPLAPSVVEEQQNAVVVAIGIMVLFVSVQVGYIYYVCVNQNPGHIRCLHLCRIVEGSSLALFWMIACLLYVRGQVTFEELEGWGVLTEIALLLFILLDAFLGFRNDSIIESGYNIVEVDDVNAP